MNPGLLCLQGGRELTEPCRDMDREVLDRCEGPIAVLAGAARPGSDYEGASARTAAYYRTFGVEVGIVPDPRSDPSGALAVLTGDVGLIVMPGGAPGGLLEVLTDVDAGSIGHRVRDLWTSGTAVSGASAGAMVMCARTATPDRSASLADGLGLTIGLAIPHWSPGSERRWAADDQFLWGLPECGGVVIDGGEVRAVGQSRPSVRRAGSWHEVDRSPEPLNP